MPDLASAVGRLKAIPGYAPLFAKAFGQGDTITVDNMARAIAAYERTLVTLNSPYDRYVKGDHKALSARQVRGMNAFAATGCTACHSGAAFDGPAMPAGQPFLARFPTFTDTRMSRNTSSMSTRVATPALRSSRTDTCGGCRPCAT